MKIGEILIKQLEILKLNNIEEAIQKARILLSYTINKSKEYLIAHDNDELSNEDVNKYEEYIQRIIQNEPIQYIIEKQEFMKMNFYVNKNVLIPRADTEILVEEALSIIQENNFKKVLDLCTGSGAIGIAIAKYSQIEKMILTDISLEALNVAKINTQKHNLKNVEIMHSNLFDKISEKVQMIVSNPPYIETKTIKTLNKDVQKEPILALDGGIDGLDVYRIIIREAYNYLEEEGYLALEIGYNQKQAVINLLKDSNKYKDIYSKKDLFGNDRIVVCRRG